MKTLNDFPSFLIIIELEYGPKIPHTRSGVLRGYRKRIWYSVKLNFEESYEELARFNTVEEAQMYAHWILTNPNRYYELKDLALHPNRDTSKTIFFMKTTQENVFEVHTEETLPRKKLPEKEVVVEPEQTPQAVPSHTVEKEASSSEETKSVVCDHQICELAEPTGVTCPPDSCDLDDKVRELPALCSPKLTVTLKAPTMGEEALARLKRFTLGMENLTEEEVKELRELFLDTSPENKAKRRKRKTELFRLAYSRKGN